MMPYVGQRAPKKKMGGLEFAKITNDSHWEIFVSLLVRDGVNFLLLLMTFLSSALSKRIFSPYSTAELSLRRQSPL